MASYRVEWIQAPGGLVHGLVRPVYQVIAGAQWRDADPGTVVRHCADVAGGAAVLAEAQPSQGRDAASRAHAGAGERASAADRGRSRAFRGPNGSVRAD